MSFSGALFSTDSNEWETPQDVFDFYKMRFNFQLDVCATEENTKVRSHFFTKKQDGLSLPWDYINWMNPPYGRQISNWVKKAYEESLIGGLTVCLLPARTDTRWWHDYVLKSDSIHFIKGRIKFLDQNKKEKSKPAPFPSCIVIFGLHYRRKQNG